MTGGARRGRCPAAADPHPSSEGSRMPRSTKHLWLLGLLLSAAATPAFARPPAPARDDLADLDPKALAELIDRRLAERWQGHDVRPADPADDATFMRRAYLDLTGRIPDLVP